MAAEELADYGTINAYYERWNENEDILIKVKTRPCVMADFGLNPEEKQANQTLYNPKQNQEAGIRKRIFGL